MADPRRGDHSSTESRPGRLIVESVRTVVEPLGIDRFEVDIESCGDHLVGLQAHAVTG